MKIIFESEEEKKDILRELSVSNLCIRDIGIEDIGCGDSCYDCWSKTLDIISEVKGEKE